MKTYYVLIETWGVYVKEGKFFEEQGGLTKNWGKRWVPVQAESIEDARRRGKELRDGQIKKKIKVIHYDELYESFGYALGMRVAQSDLYAKLDELERSECDALCRPQKKKVTEELHHWPYCLECREPFWFDPEAPLASCGCGTGEWSDPRPTAWVPCPIKGEPLYFVFDSPPGSNDSNFVEVETADGRRARVGEWKQDPKTELWKLGPVYARPVSSVDDEIVRQAKEAFNRARGSRSIATFNQLFNAMSVLLIILNDKEKKDDNKRGEHQGPA